MRTLVGRLIKKGYNTKFSYDGHGSSEPYLSFTKSSRDGTFEKETRSLRMRLRVQNQCCKKNEKPFCQKCGYGKKSPHP